MAVGNGRGRSAVVARGGREAYRFSTLARCAVHHDVRRTADHRCDIVVDSDRLRAAGHIACKVCRGVCPGDGVFVDTGLIADGISAVGHHYPRTIVRGRNR